MCVCLCGHSAREFTLLSPHRRRGHPPLTLCQQREEEKERERARDLRTHSREREGEKDWNPHNALHAAGLKSCRFISSCLEGLCVRAHTHTHTQTPSARETHRQTGKAAFLWPGGRLAGLPDDLFISRFQPLGMRRRESCSIQTTGCH